MKQVRYASRLGWTLGTVVLGALALALLLVSTRIAADDAVNAAPQRRADRATAVGATGTLTNAGTGISHEPILPGKLGAEEGIETIELVNPADAVDPGLTDWVLVAGFTGTLTVIDAATDIAYGPILSGELGTEGGGVLDIAVTPDGKTALISNFGDQAIFVVDVSNPLSPSVVTSITLPMYAEDIAIAHDGQLAMVSDGGLSSHIMVLDLISFTLAYTVELAPMGCDAQAVDIAPDGTAVVADYIGGAVCSLYPDTTGMYTVTGRYTYTLNADGSIAPDGTGTHQPWPLNVAIAPDGQTVFVCNAFTYDSPTDTLHSVGVYRIISPGVLTLTQVVTGLSRTAQSVAFDLQGDKAYLPGNSGDVDNYEFDHLIVLDILGPGEVRLDADGPADWARLTSGQFFGVDTIGVVNNKAYVGYPTNYGASNDLRIVNLSDYSVKKVDMPGRSHGVAVIPVRRVYLPVVLQNHP